MPRTARPQANRTDLLAPPPKPEPQGQPNGLPVQVPTGLAYGERAQLAGAQRAVPLPASPGQPPAPGPAVLPTGGQAARNFSPPKFAALARATERPTEPVTAGLGTRPQPVAALAGMLGRMAQTPTGAPFAQLAQRAAMEGS